MTDNDNEFRGEWIVFVITVALCSMGVVVGAVLLAALVGWSP